MCVCVREEGESWKRGRIPSYSTISDLKICGVEYEYIISGQVWSLFHIPSTSPVMQHDATSLGCMYSVIQGAKLYSFVQLQLTKNL